MNLRDMFASLIRTAVPLLIGWLASLLLSIGVELDADTTAALVLGLGNLLAALYYALARLLEARWPWLGWLLGWAVTPTYERKDVDLAA